MQPLLLPGTHVVRRGPDEIQVGLAHSAALALGRVPARLDALQTEESVVRALRRRGLLLEDDGPLRSALPAAGDSNPWVRHTLAAMARRAPDRCESSLRSRRAHVVVVSPFGHPLAEHLARDVEELCRRSGLLLPGPARPGPSPRDAVSPQPVHVLVGVGEPTRDLLDEHVRGSVPHLVVRLVEGRAVVGPFVVPGRTACVRCIDAYLTEDDPAWPLLVEQYARCTRSDRSDGIPEPVDAALAAVAVGRATRDLAEFAEGQRPLSWSATTTISADLAGFTTRDWPPHPHCGCAWG